MTRISLDNRTGGIALVVGYSLLIAVLFRNLSDGIASVTTGRLAARKEISRSTS
jgi:hypothetical protein